MNQPEGFRLYISQWHEKKGIKHGRNAEIRTVYGHTYRDVNKIRRVADELVTAIGDGNNTNPRLAEELVATLASSLKKQGEKITVKLLREKSGIR